jgi:hypothetical protein
VRVNPAVPFPMADFLGEDGREILAGSKAPQERRQFAR